MDGATSSAHHKSKRDARRDRENYGQVWRPIGLDLSLNLTIGSGATVFQLSCKMGHIIAADIATTFQDRYARMGIGYVVALRLGPVFVLCDIFSL